MAATVFVWDMFKGGVGHASMHVAAPQGSIYIGFWPTKPGDARSGAYSAGKIHFMNGDRLTDGAPQWASKPITGLDEDAIVKWWGTIQENPVIDYANKKAFQRSPSKDSAFQWASDRSYNILTSQCATTVVLALMVGADAMLRIRMATWLAINMGTGLGDIQLPALGPIRVPTVTPKDVRNLVTAIWGDI